MATVRVARHGETTWNATGRYQGRRESPLSDLGKAQAQALAATLAQLAIRRIITSPLQRCLQTALPLARKIHVDIESEPALTEIAHGVWETRYRDEIKQNDAQRFWAWKGDPEHVSFPDGESVLDVLDRWRAFARDFDPSADTLIVTHDVVARLAILEATGRGVGDLWKPRVVNGGFAIYDVTDGAWQLREECVDDYLGDLKADAARQAL